ncbi:MULTISPECIES: DNA -binding domain-containing protein [unclassified Aureimonas]|uniref:DNA -binding domain-containing protein n=1 Tax=unclassified Aureimonas TaxID=2615206 RepID=UPI0006FDB1AB|nr:MULTISPECIES: DUF2285 domain-containing protein [unclassified Aureimonas]KQT62067.1 hypothetical protein ASG62_23425 [Aureimonas sp. Leaf427]KQT72353.1 hypothetical protein ASG54_18625 [Aureimonas sp. Leaf460]
MATAIAIPLDLTNVQDAADGRYARHRDRAGEIPLLLLPGAEAAAAFAAQLPFATDSPDRVEAYLRLWRCGQGLDASDKRLTPLQRRRIPRALRAADARAHGATYREIARAFHGIERLMREDDWRESSLRTEAIDLLRFGLRLIAGDYLDLFRHRRRS